MDWIGLEAFLRGNAVLSLLILLFAFLYFPDYPPSPPSLLAERLETLNNTEIENGNKEKSEGDESGFKKILFDFQRGISECSQDPSFVVLPHFGDETFCAVYHISYLLGVGSDRRTPDGIAGGVDVYL